MGSKDKVEAISDFVKLPIIIESDDKFVNTLNENLLKYNKWVKIYIEQKKGLVSKLTEEEKKKIINQIQADKGCITRAVNNYYKGNIVSASDTIHGLLKRIFEIENCSFVKSDIDKSFATRQKTYFPDLYDTKDEKHYEELKSFELDFFRARTEFFDNPKEMFHIPLNKRNLVGTERFSIAGVPCLYLGSSVYDVWLEMGKPAFSQFNASAIRFNDEGKKLQILNLVVTPKIIIDMNDVRNDEKITKAKIDILVSMLRIYPLVIATSLRVKKANGKFRSDYIVSQLIMMNLWKLGLDGIAYISKRIESTYENFSVPQFVNIALPAFDQSKVWDDYGTICEKITITRPRNFEEFTSIDLGNPEGINNSSYFSKCFQLPDGSYSCNVPVCGKIIPYHRTNYFEYERELCGQEHWDFENIKNM